MAPEQRAALAELARLRREAAEDRAAMRAHRANAAALLAAWDAALADDAHRKGALALAAVSLHGWYTALETLAERVLRALDELSPSGERSHRQVISLALSEVPGLRPAVLPVALQGDLLALLSFRHFFRHAYAVELSSEKLRQELVRLGAIGAAVDDALDAFDAFLARSEDAAAR